MSTFVTPNAVSTIQLGYRIQNDWNTHPALFANGTIAKSDYETALTDAVAAKERVETLRSRRKSERTRLASIRAEAITKAKADYAHALTQLDAELITAVAEEKAKITTLSRLANGARYHAKSIALSDTTPENDDLGKQL